MTPAAATLHALRHSFGAHLRMSGVPLANIVVVDDNGTPNNSVDDFTPSFVAAIDLW